jgi:peroxiredoxin
MELITNKGENVFQLAESNKVLMIFLRHFGCSFCRETMCEIEKERPNIEAQGIKIVLVHMTSFELADKYLSIYNLRSLSHVSDPEKNVYSHFGLQTGKFLQLFGLKSVIRSIIVGFLKGHLPGKTVGDPKQMPGIFLFYQKAIISKFTYQSVGDRPDFKKLVSA